MNRLVICLLLSAPVISFATQPNRKEFFSHLAKLNFDSAKLTAAIEKNSQMKSEMLQLTNILYWEGQTERTTFTISEDIVDDNSKGTELSIVRALSAGYVSLFYDRTKGKAYRLFYKAFQWSKELSDPVYMKASLLAFFRYYNLEIVQVSSSFKTHLDTFEQLKDSHIDEVWLTIYRMILYSKPAGKIDDQYYVLAKSLDDFERTLSSESPVRSSVFYEKAIKFEIEKNQDSAAIYYRKVVEQARKQPFLKDDKFFSLIKLFSLATQKRDFATARKYLNLSNNEINLADTLRSKYYLNLYSSLFYRAQNSNDSAFVFLKRAYFEEYELDFRRNTLEINQLNVELETQEKENSNLRLRANRAWLTAALVGVALLFVGSYLAYTNQRAKNRIQLQDKEVQAMKFEKALKEQEVLGIDAMIEGQEKERQRIANDLHDNLGSDLVVLRFNLESIRKHTHVENPDDDQILEKTVKLLDDAYQKVRGIAHAGNVGVNAQHGLVPAIKVFASKVSVINKLTIEVDDHEMTRRLENSLEITIFRIIQELITNIIKHAHATEVTIHLTEHEDLINLMVEDNGQGFDTSQVKSTGGMGLHSIARKIENVGGRFTVESIPQKGTTVIIDVPFS